MRRRRRDGGRWATAGAAIVPSSLEASLLSAAKPARAINGGGGGSGAGRRQCAACGSGGSGAWRRRHRRSTSSCNSRGNPRWSLSFAALCTFFAGAFISPPTILLLFSFCLFSLLELQILYTYFWILGSNKHLQHFRPKDMASCLINVVTFSNRGPRGLCFIISYYYYWFHRICAEYKECTGLFWSESKQNWCFIRLKLAKFIPSTSDYLVIPYSVFICCYFTFKVVKVAKSQKVFHFGSNLQKMSAKSRPWASAL